MKQIKYIFVTGGVTSSLGKGIISASLGMLLKARGYKTTIQKLDPYINIDPGTLNPYEHGECFVTDDGSETDLDLGHYERFLNQSMSKYNNVTSGTIYQTVINKERKGYYLGKTVQIIPHITDEIKNRINFLAQKNDLDIIISEIGGTVGDIECLPFIEAVRQLKWNLGKNNVAVIHLTLLPYLNVTGEIKTKPTQHSVRCLMENGIQADFIVCRTEKSISIDIRNKIALLCNIKPHKIIESIDSKIIYEIPKILYNQNFDTKILKHLNFYLKKEPNLIKWNTFLNKYKNPKYEVKIAIVGKYISLLDAYKSINEAIIHASINYKIKVIIRWIYSGNITQQNLTKHFSEISGILVAPGFGSRGVNGKILATRYARENNIPFLGICLGMQIAIIEFFRNVLGIKNAQSTEFDPNTKYPIIALINNQKKFTNKGGTMRLGSYKCLLQNNSIIRKIYNKKEIYERHRHRYEVNINYLKKLSYEKLKFVGINPDNNLIEVIELNSHPFFIGVQYHPEYKSTVINPHPLFIHFIKATKNYLFKILL